MTAQTYELSVGHEQIITAFTLTIWICRVTWICLDNSCSNTTMSTWLGFQLGTRTVMTRHTDKAVQAEKRKEKIKQLYTE